MSEYAKKYADPRWRAKRKEILERDGSACQGCFNSGVTLHVHHRYYRWDADPWDYPNEALVTLCEECHAGETELRSDARMALVEAVSSHLTAADVHEIAEALGQALALGPEGVVASALVHHLRRPGWVHDLVESYFAALGVK